MEQLKALIGSQTESIQAIRQVLAGMNVSEVKAVIAANDPEILDLFARAGFDASEIG